MSDMVIGDYTAAVAIDGSTHYLLIQPGGASTAYKKITRNVYLGVSGQPADISTSQSFTNKILDNTNTITAKDSLFTLQDNLDTTKQAQFQLSGLTTATTRTYTLPNASSTIADIATAQTFTNKTLTAPTINNGSITGTTITTDAIVGQSAATNGTIYGLSISSGKVGTNGVVTASVTDAAITAAKLATNAITLASVSSSTVQSGISTSDVIITGLTTTVTIPSGGRKVRVEVYVPRVFITAIATPTLSIYNSATVTGSAVQSTPSLMAVANNGIMMYAFYEYTPGPGSQSYCASLRTDAGSGSTVLSATSLAFLTVKVV